MADDVPRFDAARAYSAPRPPPLATVDRFVYGLTQPLLGLRMLATNRALLIAALLPAVVLAAFCAAVALLSGGHFVHKFYTTFAVLAPLPSVVFAAHYARLAVTARHALGFPTAEPCIEPLKRVIERTIKQAILIAIAVAPVSLLLHMVPDAGELLARAVAALWALHWVVVEAFDAARILHPGQTLAELDAESERTPSPWYVRGLLRAAEHAPIGDGLIRRFAGLCDRMSVPWREEIQLVEHHPVMMLGFALAMGGLLAIPVLNLAFRPIAIIGATHVLGQLEQLRGQAKAG